jgi:hypothetical protein
MDLDHWYHIDNGGPPRIAYNFPASFLPGGDAGMNGTYITSKMSSAHPDGMSRDHATIVAKRTIAHRHTGECYGRPGECSDMAGTIVADSFKVGHCVKCPTNVFTHTKAFDHGNNNWRKVKLDHREFVKSCLVWAFNLAWNTTTETYCTDANDGHATTECPGGDCERGLSEDGCKFRCAKEADCVGVFFYNSSSTHCKLLGSGCTAPHIQVSASTTWRVHSQIHLKRDNVGVGAIGTDMGYVTPELFPAARFSSEYRCDATTKDFKMFEATLAAW